jgi:uncharacterized protein YyaL (SSP411 family)
MTHPVDNPKHTNRLIDETSPYLLQHAHNPVDWYPWGPEALTKSREENKPILLSVGYAACHWCHRLSEESFEDETTAALMNDLYVNIKVDREERPDLDTIYMEAVQALTGHGGWPMTVFLTPECIPFYGGTYYPPEPRHGMPAFRDILQGVAQAYRERPDDVAHNATQIRERLQTSFSFGSDPAEADLNDGILDEAVQRLFANFDRLHGGFGQAPKFPQGMVLDFLLRQYTRTGSGTALTMAETTLEKMARGGMYDQLGGGFHRYSVDDRWLVPHFEKMLYDNAILVPVYLHAYQLTGKDLYRRVAVETLDWVSREMTDIDGGFYSSLDADSEGHEGKFYVWTLPELEQLLGHEDARLVAEYFGATARGNFEGTNILHLPRTIDIVAQRVGVDIERIGQALDRARAILFAAREERVRPGRDEKVLTAWNGLMIRAFAEAATILGDDLFRQRAEDAATFLLRRLRRDDGRVLRTYKDGQSKLLGYLEDYAFLADGLLALYDATFAPHWLDEAHALVGSLIDLFWDAESGTFYDTGNDHEALIARPKSVFDNAIPSGSSVAIEAMQRLAIIFDRPSWREKITRILASMRESLSRYPTGFGRLLSALDFELASPKEVAIVGALGFSDTAALLNTLRSRFRPHIVIAVREPGTRESLQPALLRSRNLIDGRATAYVCQNYACQRPVTTPADLAAQLGD